MRKKLLILAIQFISWGVYAQEYAVTVAGDTIRGKVTILTYDIFDRIEIKGQDNKTNLLAMNVKVVVKNSEVYHPIKGNDGFRMMKLKSAGHLSQYYGRAQHSTSYDVLYLVRLDGEATEIPNIGFKKFMTEFLSDCESIKPKIDRGEFTKKKIDLLVENYNNCIDEQTKAMFSSPVVVPKVDDPALIAVKSLQQKIEKDTQLATQKDALDLIKDILNKVSQSQPVPNYLVEGLKGVLKDAPDYQKDLETILPLLRKG